MSDEILKTLRYLSRDDQDYASVMCGKAADALEAKDKQHMKALIEIEQEHLEEIEKLHAEIERLRKIIAVMRRGYELLRVH